MPLYEYQCPKCSKSVVRLRKGGQDDARLKCPECGSAPMKKIFSTFNTGGHKASTRSKEREKTHLDSNRPAGPEFYPLMVTNNPENLK